MTEFKFEDLSKKTVAQLRKIAEGMEHEALQDHAKMPKAELLAALCQVLGIASGEPDEKTAQDKEPAAPKDAASESAPDSSEDEEPVVQESKTAEASEKKVEDEQPAAQESEPTEPPEERAKEEPAAQESEPSEPPKESAKEEPAAVQEDAASEPAPEGAEEEEPATKKSSKKKEAPAQESTPTESPAVVNKEKSKLKLQIRELKSQRDAALEAHDHAQLKAIRRRIRTLKRNVRRIAV